MTNIKNVTNGTRAILIEYQHNHVQYFVLKLFKLHNFKVIAFNEGFRLRQITVMKYKYLGQNRPY